MAKKRNFENWCRKCKFQGNNPPHCILCLAKIVSEVPMDAPPDYMPKVRP